MRIRLERSECYGTCAAYVVEATGAGRGRFEGKAFTLVDGEHLFEVSPETVACLVDAFRAADFWSLAPEYAAEVTHMPTVTLSLEIGRQTKTVSEYAGRWAGMPASVTTLQDTIDREFSKGWVVGDATTVARLKAEGFGFRSRTAGDMVANASSLNQPAVALGLLEAGAPPNGETFSGIRGGDGTTAILAAAAAGQVEVVRALIAAGAFRGEGGKLKSAALRAGARSADPLIIADILAQNPDIDGRGADGLTALMLIGADPPDPKAPDLPERQKAVQSALLTAGADARLRSRTDDTALSTVRSVGEITALLAAGAPLEQRNDDGDTALLNAASDEIAMALIAAGADITAVNDNGERVVDRAARNKFTRTLAYIAARGQRPARDAKPGTFIFRQEPPEGERPPSTLAALRAAGQAPTSRAGAVMLVRAANRSPDAAILDLVTAGAPVNQMTSSVAYNESNTAIAAAARRGRLEVVRALIAAGGFREAAYHAREAALMAAVEAPHPAVVAELLKTGLDVNASNEEGRFALGSVGKDLPGAGDDEAAWRIASEQTVRLLLAGGADPQQTTPGGETALHRVWSAPWADMLIKAGADLEATNRMGATPLFTVLDNAAAEALIKAGANVRARDGFGSTPLHDAMDARRAQLLLKAGAELEARDQFGRTPLLAASDDGLSMALIEAGADISARANDGGTTLDRAIDSESAKTIAYLKAHGVHQSERPKEMP
ncbi:MAG: ankyrin repeat domain-containing protein [Caulobacterales bacterium]|nr:ankyrin repeat domain-containing protein [Caulobacterales bacterium]